MTVKLKHARTLALAVAMALIGFTCPFHAPPPENLPPPEFEEPAIKAALFATGFNQPLFVTAPPGDTTRIFVVERGGKIWVIRDGDRLFTPFLDVSALLELGFGEQGLLGLAFHPQYETNGYFYISYTQTGGTVVVARYTRMAGKPNRADPASAKVVIKLPQPKPNHNGGMLAFGPDGYLYFGSGDGGEEVVPSNGAQHLDSLLGKLLRLDVDSGEPYRIPLTNPYIQDPNARGEVWAYGLRNPWRWSFDSKTGDLYIGDVGALTREEISFQPAASPGGENYGWYIAEGFECVGGGGACGTNPGLTPPLVDLGRDEARSIVGGYVYRGVAMPGLRGVYFFGDFISRRIWSFRYDGTTVSEYVERTAELAPPEGRALGLLSSFGQDAHGELYFCDYADGEIYKIVPATSGWRS